jgi:uncharacterized protein DUF3352
MSIPSMAELTMSVRDPARLRHNRPALVAIGGLGLVVVALVLALMTSGAGTDGPATGAAALVPGDALAYVHLSTDASRPGVQAAQRLEGRFPDRQLIGAALTGRVGAIAGGGTTVDFATDIRPWLGREAAFALLDTPGSTARSLIVLDVARPARARRFVLGAGAVAGGRYQGTPLYHYADGTSLAFVGHYLAIGQAAGVEASISVFHGRSRSLSGSATYQRAATGEPADRVLDAYVSAAGVRRVLLARTGPLASLGGLLSRPGVSGTTVSVSAVGGGARVRVHSAVSRGSGSASGAFTPTLAGMVPSGSLLMLDVPRLDRAAPAVLAAAGSAGVGGGVAPLLSRLGTALGAEGVDLRSVLSIFDHEGAVAIGPSRSLVVLARVGNQSDAARTLAELQGPLAALFPAPSSGPGAAPVFNDVEVGGVSAHQLSLAPGLQLDYAVFRGLVVVSTSLAGIGEVASHARSLTADPSYAATLLNRPDRISSLLFLDFSQLLNLGAQIGLTRSATIGQLQPDLQKIRAVGLVSTRGEADTTAELTLQIS